jgi:transposase
MDARQQRGLVLAATKPIIQKDGKWIVPSQNGAGRYTVDPDVNNPRCSCPDYMDCGYVCKHIHAVRFVLVRTTEEQGADGVTTTTTETITVEQTVEKKKSYPQDWPNYNMAQTNERRHFHELLYDLCQTIIEPEAKKNPKGGRPSLPLRELIYAAILKVFSEKSARRSSGEQDDAQEQGFLQNTPHFNSVLKVFNRTDTTEILKELIVTSSLPLSKVETKFAVDSTGFATLCYSRWYDQKYATSRKEAKWVKAHFCTGVKTNIVTTVNIDQPNANDCPLLPGLVDKTAENFKIDIVTGDKAYASNPNFENVESHGGKLFSPFRSHTTGGVGGLFEKAFHYFSLHKEEYMAQYHIRSNVESTVSMVKRKFGNAVRAKSELAQKNEVYAKFVCHNICVLIQEMYVLGIDPSFGIKPPCTKTYEPAQILRFPG